MSIIHNTEIKRRRSIRLSKYDYSRNGYYFITINLKTIACMFAIRNKKELFLTDVGKIAEKYWHEIPMHFNNASIDKYVFMPDHMHGIIVLNGDKNVWVRHGEPIQLRKTQKQHKYQQIIPKSLGIIINHYKSAVTRWCRKNEYPQFRWRRNYYERIILDEDELNKIREYINLNPEKLKVTQKNW